MNNNAKRMMPNASIEQYYHYWLQNIPEKCDRGIVGYVRNYENPEIKITIEIDDRFMNERNHPNMCFCFEEKSYVSESEIVMTSDFFNHIYNNKALLAGLWHEIGHFHTLHYFDYKGHQNKEKKSINDYRNKLYESKKVAEEEYAADLFSVYYTSKEEWLQFIRFMIRRRYNMEWDVNRFMAVNEMRDRRELINKINTEETIKEELCRLCGIEEFSSI